MFITSKNKYLSNDMKIFGTCSIPLMLNWLENPKLSGNFSNNQPMSDGLEGTNTLHNV